MAAGREKDRSQACSHSTYSFMQRMLLHYAINEVKDCFERLVEWQTWYRQTMISVTIPENFIRLAVWNPDLVCHVRNVLKQGATQALCALMISNHRKPSEYEGVKNPRARMFFEVCIAAFSGMGEDVSIICHRRRVMLPSYKTVAQVIGHITDVVGDIRKAAANVCKAHENSQFNREIIANGGGKRRIRIQHPDRYIKHLIRPFTHCLCKRFVLRCANGIQP